MAGDRNINFYGSGGAYNESIHVQGDFIQGDKVVGQDLKQAAADIQQLLLQLQTQYSPAEAQQTVAQELANRARQNPEYRRTLDRLFSYVATMEREYSNVSFLPDWLREWLLLD